MDKGKAKMPEYEGSDGNESPQSLDSEHGGLDFPIMRTPRPSHRSTKEKNIVSQIGYNDYMAYHYAFMMKVVIVREPETFSEATKDPWLVKAMNEEIQALSKNETWELILASPH